MISQMQKEDSILMSFKLDEEILQCLVCRKTLDMQFDQTSTILNHLREFSHQEILHRFYLENQQIQVSYPLFDQKQASEQIKTGGDKALLKYFDEQIKDLFANKKIKDHTLQTYQSVLRQFYLKIFKQGKNSFNNKEMKDYISFQKNKDNKSILKQLHKMIESPDKSLKKQSEPKIQQCQQLTNENVESWFQLAHLETFIQILKELKYTRLCIVLLLLAETELTIDELLLVFYSQLKAGVQILHSKSQDQAAEKQKKFIISAELSIKIKDLLQNDLEKLSMDKLIYSTKSTRTIQCHLTKGKQKVLRKLEIINSNDETFQVFVKNILLNHIQKFKQELNQNKDVHQKTCSLNVVDPDQNQKAQLVGAQIQQKKEIKNYKDMGSFDLNQKPSQQSQGFGQFQIIDHVVGLKKKVQKLLNKSKLQAIATDELISISSENQSQKHAEQSQLTNDKIVDSAQVENIVGTQLVQKENFSKEDPQIQQLVE